ncbi:SKU5 similar 5 [Actinidia rufa]|uniref:SKU5 similar 5 n=1 Tax=Actinidia rufa TaxID=165716 RepID=A0A7J0ETF9_9ERIC|nr:SKU5 similar 5 [Actinidia rufa]
MVYNRGKIHTKMGFMEPHAPFHQAKTTLTLSRSKIRLAASSISPLLISTRLPAASEESEFSAGLSFQSPSQNPTEITPVLIGDWYKADHNKLKGVLDGGHRLAFPDGILISGRGPSSASFTVEQGKTYRLRISNVGLQNTLNFRIQGHNMKLVEVEGTHTLQTILSSLDVHVGQSYSVLVTADQSPQDYYIAVSTRFTSGVLNTTATLHYSNSAKPVSGQPPSAPTTLDWSLNQARSIRTNLTASGPRPNPQGSYHYGLINITRTIRLANSAALVNGKQRYAVNSVSFVPADTPLKLADYFKIGGVFTVGSIPDSPTGAKVYLDTSVMGADYRAFVEVVFENHENIVQSWHLDGYSFFVVGMDGGEWSAASRQQYNLRDAVSRCTTQVYPSTWDNNFIYAFIQRPHRSGMSIPFRRMPFSVVELRAESHDQFDEASEEDEETDLNSRKNLTSKRGRGLTHRALSHYGLVNNTRIIRLANSAALVNGKQRYAVNSVSFVPTDMPLKLAHYFKIGGVFTVGSISYSPTSAKLYLNTSVMGADYRAFIENVFENGESIVQSWHLDGMDGGGWSAASRHQYNLQDAVSLCTTQVYPSSWTAVYIPLDKVRDEYPIPKNALLCGRAPSPI